MAATMTVGLLTGGCTAAATSDSGHLASSLGDLAREWSTQEGLSDWDRAVLEKASETGVVSQADYDEGANNFEACLQAGGLHWIRTRLLNGVVEFQPSPENSSTDEHVDAAAVQENCYVATWGSTQELFRMQQANPDLLSNFSLATVDCLRKARMVGDDFTADDFDEAMGSRDAPRADWPFDVMDPRAQTCLYSLGYAIAIDAR
ncbi:hypothetical protein ACF044_08545 [Microbacterium sp. NPDC016588]